MKELIAYYTEIGRHDVVANLKEVQIDQTIIDNENYSRLSDELENSFYWKYTEMGYDYWNNLFSELLTLNL
jgi:hypothetical protein